MRLPVLYNKTHFLKKQIKGGFDDEKRSFSLNQKTSELVFGINMKQ